MSWSTRSIACILLASTIGIIVGLDIQKATSSSALAEAAGCFCMLLGVLASLICLAIEARKN